MSSEHLASAQNQQKGNLAGAWDALSGAQGQYADFGIARRFGGSAAAYSLRDIGAMVGPVLRVRRSTDNVEVDVRLDGSGKVSLDSPIANVVEDTGGTGEDGTTNASTLNGFLNSDVITQNIKQGTANSITVTRNFTDSPTDVLFTYPADGSNRFMNVSMDGYSDRFGKGTYDVSFNYEIVSSSAGTVKFTIEGSTEVSGDGTNNFTISGSGTFSGRGSITQPKAVYFLGNSTSDATVRITNFSVTQVQSDAFVQTWYDQSGNGRNAIQNTADNQPKIATDGSLDSALTFDGTNDFLQTTDQVLTGTQTGSNGLYIVANVTSGDSGYLAGSADDGTGVGQSIYASHSSSKFILTEGLDATAADRDTMNLTAGSDVLISACYNNNDPNTLQKNSSTTGYTDGGDSYTFTAGTKFTIGHRRRSGGVNAATNLTGTIKEVVAFDIDTTSDRADIQRDIQNYYNL
jgi:hypothetical protein